MGDPPGVVVVGSGFGCFTHARALRAAGFEVRALVGRDPDKTARRAAQFEIPVATTDLGEALGLPGVDAVTVATPPNTHASITLAAIDAGKHVICEKPFARDVREARQMVEAAKAAGVVALVGTEFRFDAGQETLARTVHSGAIGSPRLATFVLHVGVLAGADPILDIPTWWADAHSGGGWLSAHGSQVIDQIRVTLGEFEAVSALVVPAADGSAMTADDGFTVQFRLDGGCVGVMQSTATDRGPMFMETRVTGSAGTAWIEGVGDRVFVADDGGTRRVEVDEDLVGEVPPGVDQENLDTTYERMIAHGLDLPPYTRLARTFRAMIEGERPPTRSRPADFAEGLRSLAVLEACRESAAGAGWVRPLYR